MPSVCGAAAVAKARGTLLGEIRQRQKKNVADCGMATTIETCKVHKNA